MTVLIVLVVFALLVTVVPLAVRFYDRRRTTHEAEPSTTRFMGTQLDLAILVLGLMVLLVVVAWIYRIVFR